MQLDTRAILYKVAEEFDLKRGSTAQRLKLQKTIYLLQAYGMPLGYGFSWYRYGPYSQDLVYDAYRVLGPEKNKYAQATNSWKFSESSLKRFREFKSICSNVLNDPEKLELLASVDFIRKTWYPESNRSEIARLFKKHKTRFFDGNPIQDVDIERAFDLCGKLKIN